MKQPTESRWEERVHTIARRLAYPPTSDLAGAVQQRLTDRSALSGQRRLRPVLALLVALVLLLSGLLAVPSVRAAIVEWLQIGAVRIWFVEPTPTPLTAQPVPSPRPTPTLLPTLFDLAGATTLAEAQQKAGFPLRLPTYPATLGEPDHVYVQQTNGWFVVLIWMAPHDPQQVQLVLYELGPGVGLSKSPPTVLRTTQVHQRPAVWIEGIHYLEHATGGWQAVRIIDQDVLVWSEAVAGQEITYRLETTLSEAQAVQMAESLQ